MGICETKGLGWIQADAVSAKQRIETAAEIAIALSAKDGIVRRICRMETA
jgi:hypothetical protein